MPVSVRNLTYSVRSESLIISILWIIVVDDLVTLTSLPPLRTALTPLRVSSTPPNDTSTTLPPLRVRPFPTNELFRHHRRVTLSAAVNQLQTTRSQRPHLRRNTWQVKTTRNRWPHPWSNTWQPGEQYLAGEDYCEQATGRGERYEDASVYDNMAGDHTRMTVARRGKLVTFYRNGDPYYKVSNSLILMWYW